VTVSIWLAIALGGALGAIARFGFSHQVYTWLGRDFVWGTLAVNILGSFLFGLLTVLLVEKWSLGIEWRMFFLVGFLGAFTTFSTFAFDTMMYFENGELAKALINMLVSVVTTVIAVGLGIWLAKQFISNS
jgi:CrcB protein